MPLLGEWFAICRLRLDIVYLCAKLDDSSFNHSRDMVVANQYLNDLRDLPRHILELICHPWATTCYDQHIYQIGSFYLHPLRIYEKRYKMSKLEWFGVVRITQGHWK